MKNFLYAGWIAICLLLSCKTVKLASSDATPPVISEWRVMNVDKNNTVIYKGQNNEITVNYNDVYIIFCWAQDPQGVKRIEISGKGVLQCSLKKTSGVIFPNISSTNIVANKNSNTSSSDKDGKVPVELATNVHLKVKDFACKDSNYQPGSGYITFSGTAINYHGVTSSISILKIKFSTSN